MVPHRASRVRGVLNDWQAPYREIRIENEVTDEQGGKAQLKPGANVDVIVEADSSATLKKPE